MKKLISVLGILFFCLVIFASVSLAQHSHGGMSTGTPMKMDTKEVLVEGVKVSFQIMANVDHKNCLLYTSPSPRDGLLSRMPSSA